MQGQSTRLGMIPCSSTIIILLRCICIEAIIANNILPWQIDATGSVVQKIRTPTGHTAHIFLYEFVVKVGEVQMPVAQMLSERQDASGIIFWIQEFQKAGTPSPNEEIIDNSLALKVAVAMTLCDCRSDYYEKCIKHIIDKEPLPKAFLRPDFAHLIGGACKWRE